MDHVVTITHLELTRRDQLRPVERSSPGFNLVRTEIPCPEFSRFLYTAVGARWWWYNRLSWDYLRWLAYLDRPEVETWVAYVAGTPAGYFELERQPNDHVEIVYFGLLPQFVGRGLGGELLTAAVERAWEMGAQRVWVHTCDLDHPAALSNYQARGFTVFHVESKIEHLPDPALEVWPNAGQVVKPAPDSP